MFEELKEATYKTVLFLLLFFNKTLLFKMIIYFGGGAEGEGEKES